MGAGLETLSQVKQFPFVPSQVKHNELHDVQVKSLVLARYVFPSVHCHWHQTPPATPPVANDAKLLRQVRHLT